LEQTVLRSGVDQIYQALLLASHSAQEYGSCTQLLDKLQSILDFVNQFAAKVRPLDNNQC